MTDTDKAAAVVFLQLRRINGPAAIRDSPCVYRDHEALTAMTPAQACNHAMTLLPIVKNLHPDEWQRLHDVGVAASST